MNTNGAIFLIVLGHSCVVIDLLRQNDECSRFPFWDAHEEPRALMTTHEYLLCALIGSQVKPWVFMIANEHSGTAMNNLGAMDQLALMRAQEQSWGYGLSSALMSVHGTIPHAKKFFWQQCTMYPVCSGTSNRNLKVSPKVCSWVGFFLADLEKFWAIF